MRSKLEELFDDESFAVGSTGYDNGVMVNQQGDPVEYMMLRYADRWDVYLNLFDEGEAPFRNILVKGSAKDKNTAKELAVEKLNKSIS